MRFVHAAAGALAALALSAGVASTSLAQVNLVQNGGFELTNGGGTVPGYGTPGYGSPPLVLTDWSNSGYNFLFNETNAATGVYGSDGLLALWAPGNGSFNGLGASPDGGNFWAADGAYQQGPLSQTINGLTVGHTYALSFYYGGAQQLNFNGATTEAFSVSLGADTQNTTVLNNASHGFTGWMSQTFDYTASSTSEVLSFLAVGTPNGVPPFTLLDGVTLYDTSPPPPPSPSTPEPGSVASLCAGAFVIGSAIRRRVRK